MHKLILYILFGLPGPQLMAQQTISSDSIYLYDQTYRQQQWAHSGTTHLLFRDYNNVARAQLYAGLTQGSFRRSQEAYKQHVAGFHTDGIKSIGRFTMAGKFDFEKTWEDSAAWWNDGEYNEAQPYYFFAGKAGAYEKQLYNLSATVTYNLLKNKFYVGAGGNYRYHRTTRSVDPRPEVNAFSTILRPEITWRHKQQLIGAGFVWGRGSDEINISYKSRNYSGNQTYIERNNFMSLGFGYIGKMQYSLDRYNETSGFFAHYANRLKNWELQAAGGYELWQQDITLDASSTRGKYNLYAFLQQEKTHGSLLLNHTGNKSRQQWGINFTTQNMLNWASEFNATSYQYTANEASITYRQIWPENTGIRLEAGAGCEYKDQLKEDVVAAHVHQLKVITPHVYVAIYRQAPGKAPLSLSILPSYRHTLTNELSVPPTQENYFTRGVVYTDYLYWQKNSMELTTQFKYMQKEAGKRYRLGCTVNLKYQQSTAGTHTELPALYIPSGNRWGISASLNLYL
ncbi:MAG TPA: hypothetical protein VIM79_17290 [Niastella sp.]